MVVFVNIMVDNRIIEKVFDDAITKHKLIILKCRPNSVTLRGEGAVVTMAGSDGVRSIKAFAR